METIKETLSGNKYMILISAEDLKQVVYDFIEEYHKPSELNENYFEANKVCELLGVTKPTLWRWDKEGYLKKLKFGMKVMYRESDVQRILNQKA